MTSTELSQERWLPPVASSATQARQLVRETLRVAQATDWLDDAELVVSEVVTNALVHAATQMHVVVRVGPTRVRVEVRDGSAHLPVRRDFSLASGTGRGLHLIAELADDWGAYIDGDGKVVWFEMRGDAASTRDEQRLGDGPADPDGALTVELRNFPLLIHAAWQEHAAALLRELLLISIDEGAPATFQEHAGASDAMNLLAEQVPVLELGPEPEAIMSAAVEPSVSMRSLPLRVPRSSVASFAVLDAMLSHATALAEAGALLATPTQPEVVELRQWICSQVHHQSTGETAAEPWSLRADVLQPADVAFDAGWDPQATTDSPRARLAMDEHGIIVAVSRSAATLLGYQEQSELIGHRIIRIVPPRYHQAHIGGMTLHLTNGRSPLLGRRLAVPVVKQDGTEVTVTLLVEPHLLPGGHRLFFADFAAPGTTNEPPQVSSEGSRQAGTAPTA